jgi:hypothetical protein
VFSHLDRFLPQFEVGADRVFDTFVVPRNGLTTFIMIKKTINIIMASLLVTLGFWSCTGSNGTQELARQIRENKSYVYTKDLARSVVRSGFNAGDGYGEVLIRD